MAITIAEIAFGDNEYDDRGDFLYEETRAVIGIRVPAQGAQPLYHGSDDSA